ncbi:organic cation transporter protein-like isoform X2 [Achroia grisella]|uniref:organic cation transporter protein-like isoform X2 n=1 Tax=Achroia grisella TaxID=688607 RepID=UPI0027D31C85|nr:organic cation transporter protein-like isoform X2 [Achroia grisella]
MYRLVDELLSKFSVFGRYHVSLMVLAWIAFMSNSIYCHNYIFVADAVSYRCKDENFGNDLCRSQNSSVEYCTEWIYDNPDSFVAEFGLACQEWKRTLVGTIHSFGYMVGLLLVGPMSDRLGRKLSIVITGMLGGIFGVARSFSMNYWLYIILEFLEAAIGDICSPMFVLTIEIVSSKNRLLFYILSTFGYTFGGILLSGSAYAFPYWRTFLRVVYAPALLFFFYLFVIDESPRWLLIKGKKEEAVAILEKAAKLNKIKLDKAVLEKLETEKEKDIEFVRLLKVTFRSKTLLKRFFICIIWWSTSTFVNYGLTINSVSLQGNKYINYALICIMDIPANIIILLALNRFKKKYSLIASFLVGAILCLSQPFMPTNLSWLSLVLYMAGKLMSSFYFSITYIYTSELFPTYTRNSMHALSSSLGRIGSIIAPQTPLLMHYWSGLPSFVFGSTSLFAGLITFLVPDTGADSLPDTVCEAEAVGKTDLNMKTPPINFVIPKNENFAKL